MSILILRQNATFQTGNFQWCVTHWKLIFYCCVTRISWLQKWTVIVACHSWCIKLRHICNMAETLLVEMAMATTTAVPRSFSASGLIRGYHVYQKIWTPHVGDKATTVTKRTRKRTQTIHSSGAQEQNVVHSGYLSWEISRIAFFIGVFQLCIIFLMFMPSKFPFLHYIAQIVNFEWCIIGAPMVVLPYVSHSDYTGPNILLS